MMSRLRELARLVSSRPFVAQASVACASLSVVRERGRGRPHPPARVRAASARSSSPLPGAGASLAALLVTQLCTHYIGDGRPAYIFSSVAA